MKKVPGVTRYTCELVGLDSSQSYRVFVTAFNAAGGTEVLALDETSTDTEQPGLFSPLAPVPVPVNQTWAIWIWIWILMVLMMTLGWRRLAGRWGQR